MRLSMLLIFSLLLGSCFGAEPAVVSFPQASALVRTRADFEVISAGVNASVGVKAQGSVSGLTITLRGGLLNDYLISRLRNGETQELNYTLFKGADYYLFRSFDLVDGDELIIDFKSILGYGTHNLFVSFEGVEASHNVESALRIEDGFKQLLIDQGSWIQGLARVGRQVAWISIIDATNVNDFEHESLINVSLLPDASNIRVNEELLDLVVEDLTAYWRDSLSAQETKRYAVSIKTPPIVKGSQVVSLLDVRGDDCLIRNNLTIINLASIDYDGAIIDFNTRFTDVVNVLCDCVWQEFDGLLRVSFLKVNASSINNLVIDYWDKPPVFIIVPGVREYYGQPVINTTLFLLPNEPLEGFNLEFEVIAPDGGLVFADLFSFEELSVNELFNHSITFSVDNAPIGNYTINAVVKQGFDVVAVTSEWFIINPSESFIDELVLLLIIILFILFLIRLRLGN